MSSINLGQPLVQSEGNSRIALEIKRIAKIVSGGAVPIANTPSERRTLWGSLFKREAAQNQFDLHASLEKV